MAFSCAGDESSGGIFESFMQTKREEFVLTEDMKAAEKSYNEKFSNG
ncbi:MAG: hypothetical protein HWD58_09320 [Bacteroidota bacterium]|nr:MAG: hypothetical protein HWD58_09320 [Bacteroidota bacterium]